MKTIFLKMRVASAIGFGAISIMGVLPTNSKNTIITLEEALKRADINIQLKANGNCSGNSVEMVITSQNHVKISIPSGYLFNPSSKDQQILLAPLYAEHTVLPNKLNIIKLKGFCTQANNKCPIKDGKMSVTLSKDSNLIKLAAFLTTYKIDDESATQAAIWCVTNKHSIASVHLDDTEKSLALKNLLHKITNLPVPWNTAKQKVSIDPFGNISTVTTTILGNISFFNPSQTQVSHKVIDSAGNIKLAPSAPKTIPAGVTAKLKFELAVSGWKKGKYAVIYFTSEGKELLRQEFLI